ncbi:transporter substrate-binding domain-containing protein [Salinicoccus sp. HZC-1]|uniref:transporter substrate-binding domain-containing protein n=1 Tax=Salinicoccus sp. HZC-1 TaxID=3385497 RepID=UPI00398B786D
MKRIYGLVILLMVLVLTACSNSDASETGDTVITVATTPDGYPQNYMEDGELKGFSVDVYKAIFDEIGYEIEWLTTDWAGAVASFETGKADTLLNFAVTPERAEKYNYTETYYYSRAGLGVAEDNGDINSLEDVKGKKVGNVMGSNYGEVLKEQDPAGTIEIVSYEGADVIHQDVINGNVDAYVTGREILLAQVKDKGIPLKVVEESFGEKEVALPFAKTEENAALIEEINSTITKFREDGTLSEISNEWFGEDVTVSQQK